MKHTTAVATQPSRVNRFGITGAWREKRNSAETPDASNHTMLALDLKTCDVFRVIEAHLWHPMYWQPGQLFFVLIDRAAPKPIHIYRFPGRAKPEAHLI